ncbi:MAG: 2Fe-2S iron-sulfur cluster-binding protein [Steroidobacteraceae bacterium]
MPRVRVTPGKCAFEADSGEVVMRAANRAGTFWPTICGGEGLCGACQFAVTPDTAGLDAATPAESEGLGKLGRTPATHRLACQARVAADVTLRHPRVRAARPGDRLPFE